MAGVLAGALIAVSAYAFHLHQKDAKLQEMRMERARAQVIAVRRRRIRERWRPGGRRWRKGASVGSTWPLTLHAALSHAPLEVAHGLPRAPRRDGLLRLLLPPPPPEPSESADLAQLREEVDAVRAESKRADEHALAEKERLLASIRQVREQLAARSAAAAASASASAGASAGAPAGAPAGASAGGREVAVQAGEEEEEPPTTPACRRVADHHKLGLPSRQPSTRHVGVEDAGSAGGAAGGGRAGAMQMHTDDMGVVTPISSFSAINAQQAASSRRSQGVNNR